MGPQATQYLQFCLGLVYSKSKRGLSWHITVGTFRNEKNNTRIIIQVFDAATQDTHTTCAVLKNSSMNTSLKEAYVRSDNAGCFHGSASISAMPFLSTNIRCTRMDFADPQFLFVIEKHHMHMLSPSSGAL